MNICKRLHGEDYLKKVTAFGTGVDPTAVDETVLETIVDATVAWFERRGYELDEEGVELLSWIDLFAKPRHAWGERETARLAEAERTYPHRVIATAQGTTAAVGDDDDRRHFDDDALESLDQIRWRNTLGYGRGNT